MMHVTDSGMYPDGKSFWNLECPRGHKRTVIQRDAPVRYCKCERPVKPEQPKLFGGDPMTDLLPLARRLVAAPGWRWLPGMLAVPADNPAGRAYRITAVDSDGRMCGVEDGCVSYPRTWGLDGMDGFDGMDPVEWVPDISDDLTALSLLVLLRQWWGVAAIWVCPSQDGEEWRVESYVGPSQKVAAGATEVEALVAALEVTP